MLLFILLVCSALVSGSEVAFFSLANQLDQLSSDGKYANRDSRIRKMLQKPRRLLATILIGNTIRLSIFARRREIEVMKLVGASNWFVRGPFMVEGLLTGVLGAAAAIVLLFLGKELVLPATIGRLDVDDVNALRFEYTALILLMLGLLLGAAGSTLTMRRFLRV